MDRACLASWAHLHSNWSFSQQQSWAERRAIPMNTNAITNTNIGYTWKLVFLRRSGRSSLELISSGWNSSLTRQHTLLSSYKFLHFSRIKSNFWKTNLATLKFVSGSTWIHSCSKDLYSLHFQEGWYNTPDLKHFSHSLTFHTRVSGVSQSLQQAFWKVIFKTAQLSVSLFSLLTLVTHFNSGCHKVLRSKLFEKSSSTARRRIALHCFTIQPAHTGDTFPTKNWAKVICNKHSTKFHYSASSNCWAASNLKSHLQDGAAQCFTIQPRLTLLTHFQLSRIVERQVF